MCDTVWKQQRGENSYASCEHTHVPWVLFSSFQCSVNTHLTLCPGQTLQGFIPTLLSHKHPESSIKQLHEDKEHVKLSYIYIFSQGFNYVPQSKET